MHKADAHSVPLPMLVPHPREVTWTGQGYHLPLRGAIALADSMLLFEAQYLQRLLADNGYSYTLALPSAEAAVTLALTRDLAPQAYWLTITPERGVVVTASEAAGIFYGVCTLAQLLAAAPDLPGVQIEDRPDFRHRGYMLDISRDRVPTREMLFLLVNELAGLKYNQLQLYTEHTFAYPGHELVWQEASPLTSEDLLLLDRYCAERHIELVPNQNSLGHFERWLKHASYRALAESPDGFLDHSDQWRAASTLDPRDPASLQLVSSLYDALLPHFTSRQFNVGCDEPWELGQGKSREAVAARGGRVYLDWLLALHRDVTARGLTMMFWGDIIIHYPDLVAEVPRDAIVLEWGYEATHPFDANSAQYAAAGIPFYVCAGTSSWNSLVGRADNTIGNIQAAVEAGLKHGAVGVLVTDWGDGGHWQAYPVSYIGIVYGAAASWCYKTNSMLDVAAALDVVIYFDAAHVMGAATWALANLYHQTGPDHINGQVLAYLLQQPAHRVDEFIQRAAGWGGREPDLRPETLRAFIQAIDQHREALSEAKMPRADAGLILEEWQHMAALLRHSAGRMLLQQGEQPGDTALTAADLLADAERLIEAQRRLWLARSRPGGLEDSLRRFQPLLAEYRAKVEAAR